MADEHIPTFDAFLSYSRKDAAFATLLEKRLEAFNPPRGLGLPDRRLAIFRDESDIRGSDYYLTIEDQIRRCAKMLVICSPHARGSAFVNDEIRRFAGFKPPADIIPIIVSGIPNNEARAGQEDQMAFPQALADVMAMPLAVNYLGFDPRKHKLNRGIYYGSWFMLLAALYGVTREAIEERERRRIVRRRFTLGSVAAAVVATIATAGIVAVFQKREADRQRGLAQEAARAERRQRGLAEEAARAERRARIASEARELASRALPLLDQKPQLALLLAAEALQVTRRAGEPVVDSARRTLEEMLPQVQSRPFPAGTPKRLSSTPLGRRIVTSDAAEARVWSLKDDGEVTLAAKIPTHGATIDHPHEGRWLVAWKEDQLSLFDLASARPGATARTIAGRYVTTSRDGHWLVTIKGREPSLWSLQGEGAEAIPLPEHHGKTAAIVFSQDSKRLVTAGPDGHPQLWSVPPAAEGPQELPAGWATHTVRFSPDGRWLLVSNTDASEGGSSRDTVLWDLGRTPAVSHPISAKNLAIAEFSDESDWLAIVGWDDVYQDQYVQLWRLQDAPRRYLLRRRGEETNHIEFRKNWMATGSRFEGFGLLWDLSLLKEAVSAGESGDVANQIIDRFIAPVTLSTDQRGFSRVSFLPEGDTVLTLDTAQRLRLFELQAVGGAEKVWQLRPGSPRLLRGHETKITLCDVHPESGLILTAAENEPPRVWNVRTPATGALAGLTVEQLLVRAGQAAGRNLTQTEWAEQFPGKPYERTFENLP